MVEYTYGDYCYTDYNLDNGHYAECRYAERPYTGCHGTTYTSFCKQKATVSHCHPSLTFVGNAVAGSLNKRLMLSSSFRCDQIYNYEIYNFGHTLLCYLSPT